MASLYLARRRGAAGFRKLVAIKVVRQGLSESSAMIRMFVNEARITAHVAHPNVVHVEELGESAGLFYLVMEYVHGCSLSQLARSLAKKNRRLSARAAVAITMRIAEGLGAVHEARDEQGRPLQIVHRDVSPQNVLLSAQGHVKLIDFGVAKASLGEAAEEESGEIKGKIAYMAPEQAHAAPVDARIDQYALGVILWELLAGRRLFSGSDEIELLRQVREPQIVKPSVYAPGISGALEDVVMRALSPQRDDRYPSVRDLRRALATALPESVAVDSDALADLVRSTVGDELERVMRELPEEATRVLSGPASVPVVRHSTEEVLATLTSPASTPAADRPSQRSARATDRSMQRSAAQRSAAPTAVPPPSTGRSGWGWRAALAVAALGVGVALGSWVARGTGGDAAAMPVVPEPLVEAEHAAEGRPASPAVPVPVTTSSVAVAPPEAAGALVAPQPTVAGSAAVDEEDESASEARAQRARRARRRRAAAGDGPRTPSVVHGTPLLTDLP